MGRSEEVVDASWKVLCSVALKFMRFDINDGKAVADCKSRLHKTIADMMKAM